MSRQRSIMIGDYADITFKNEVKGDETYRYYIIKIEPGEIKIDQWNDVSQILILKPNNGIWQIDNYTEPHTITFNKNKTDTDYIERDFTKAPTKIINIASYQVQPGFNELENGIIFYEYVVNKGKDDFFIFSDPNNSKTYPNHIGPFKYEQTDSFLYTRVSLGSPHKIITFDKDFANLTDNSNEIFIYDFNTGAIMGFNPNNFTFTEYDRNPLYKDVYPLKNKKILCLSQGDIIYISDLITKTKILVNTTILNPKNLDKNQQLSNGDIVVENQIYNFNKLQIDNSEFYRININDGTMKKIVSLNYSIDIIAITQDDKFLLFNFTDNKIQILDPETNHITDLLVIPTIEVKFNNTIHSKLLLRNGDILFGINRLYYLFKYRSREIFKLSSLENTYTKNLISICQLKNGNLLLANAYYLTIMEFPHSQNFIDRRNFDQISSTTLPGDMLTLIKDYL